MKLGHEATVAMTDRCEACAGTGMTLAFFGVPTQCDDCNGEGVTEVFATREEFLDWLGISDERSGEIPAERSTENARHSDHGRLQASP